MIEKVEEHKEGPPWTIHRRFSTFEEANKFRSGLLLETDSIQAKVHWACLRDDFVVKTRVDPAATLAKEAALRREEKKKRKVKLNKKRRKK
jgi:hypothetical protein